MHEQNITLHVLVSANNRYTTARTMTINNTQGLHDQALKLKLYSTNI